MSYRDLAQQGHWHGAHLLYTCALQPDDDGPSLFDEEGLASRDRQVCRLCGRLWDPDRWGSYAPEGWDNGMCVPCRLIIEELFV